MMAVPTYQIYALKYAGPFIRPACMMTWFQDMDKTVLVNYYIFVIRGKKETIVVDCGVRPELARKRQLINYINPIEVLRRMDIEANQVRHLVATHIHFDHISGIRLFPKAKIYLQEKEFRFWMEDPIAQRAPFKLVSDPTANRYLKKLAGTDRLRLIRGDKRILPGITLVLAPGHTPGHQVIIVNTAKGTAVVGSDLAHLSSSFRTDIPSAIITDLVAWMKSYDKIRALSSSLDLIFPGHDPALLENFPKEARDISRLV
ncbi:MAG: N-acyl homoserine lactonase family protein [Thermodesulfobacteriota bacterium]